MSDLFCLLACYPRCAGEVGGSDGDGAALPRAWVACAGGAGGRRGAGAAFHNNRLSSPFSRTVGGGPASARVGPATQATLILAASGAAAWWAPVGRPWRRALGDVGGRSRKTLAPPPPPPPPPPAPPGRSFAAPGRGRRMLLRYFSRQGQLVGVCRWRPALGLGGSGPGSLRLRETPRDAPGRVPFGGF